MRFLTLFVLAIAAALPCFAQSDVDVKDGVATQFTRSKGASLVGQTIHWHVPAKAFNLPKRSRAGFALFVSSGIGILADAQSNGVEEVRRRGGEACVRGRVIEVPPKEREPGDPAFAIIVYDLSHRKHKEEDARASSRPGRPLSDACRPLNTRGVGKDVFDGANRSRPGQPNRLTTDTGGKAPCVPPGQGR